jgi:hypothetical protein
MPHMLNQELYRTFSRKTALLHHVESPIAVLMSSTKLRPVHRYLRQLDSTARKAFRPSDCSYSCSSAFKWLPLVIRCAKPRGFAVELRRCRELSRARARRALDRNKFELGVRRFKQYDYVSKKIVGFMDAVSYVWICVSASASILRVISGSCGNSRSVRSRGA